MGRSPRGSSCSKQINKYRKKSRDLTLVTAKALSQPSASNHSLIISEED